MDKNSNKRLAIHHHALIFVDSNGKMWAPSFIGRWIDELSHHFLEIVLLFTVTNERIQNQDYKILAKNVILINIGPNTGLLNHISNFRRMRGVVKTCSKPDDILIVRGITPRQIVVWNAIKTKNKYFLLVGTPAPYNIVKIRRFSDVYKYFITRWRIFEFRKIIQTGSCIVNAPHLMPEIKQKYGIDPIFIPTNTIKLSEFQKPEIVATKNINTQIKLLYCGRLTRAKGIFEILETAANLQTKSIDFRLDIVGFAGEGESEEIFHKFSEKLKIDGLINWHGFIKFGPELFSMYHSADILLLPSYSEGMPHVVWEAAAFGCVVISSRIGGIPFLFEHLDNIYFIDQVTPGNLTEAVVSLLENGELRTTIKNNAYEFAKKFTIESCVSRLANELTKVQNITNDKRNQAK